MKLRSTAALAATLVLCLAFGTARPAHAAPPNGDAVIGLAPGTHSLKLYAKAYDDKPAGELAAKDLKLPLAVLATDQEFLQVEIGGRRFWLDGNDVSLRKAVKFDCKTPDLPPAGTVASMQGASRGCR